ncbi:hypothetical protein [Humidesulfovibrio idahonensis]
MTLDGYLLDQMLSSLDATFDQPKVSHPLLMALCRFGMTRADIASAIGTSPRQVKRWQEGSIGIAEDVEVELCGLLALCQKCARIKVGRLKRSVQALEEDPFQRSFEEQTVAELELAIAFADHAISEILVEFV